MVQTVGHYFGRCLWFPRSANHIGFRIHTFCPARLQRNGNLRRFLCSVPCQQSVVRAFNFIKHRGPKVFPRVLGGRLLHVYKCLYILFSELYVLYWTLFLIWTCSAWTHWRSRWRRAPQPWSTWRPSSPRTTRLAKGTRNKSSLRKKGTVFEPLKKSQKIY